MHFEARPIVDRSPAPRRDRPRFASPIVVGAGCGGGQFGGNWMDAAQASADACVPQALMQRGCPDPNGNSCRRPTRPVPVGASNAVAVNANGAFSVSVSLQAPFKPEMLQIDPTVAATLSISSIKYGPTEKLIGGTVSGSQFSTASLSGGFRLPSDDFLVPGQTITITGTSTAAYAIAALLVDIAGFTTAP